MAVKLIRIACLALALLTLGSCSVFQFLLGSVFPSTITLLKAQVDLSASLSENDGGSLSLRVINANGSVYAVLCGTTAAYGNVLWFFDADLNNRKKVQFTLTQEMGVVVDGGGQIIAGNNIFNSDLSGGATFSAGSTVGSGPGVGVDGFRVNSPTLSVVSIYNYDPSTLTLQYQSYGDPFSSGSTASGPVSATLSANPSFSSLQVEAVLDDGTPGGNVIIIVGPGNPNNGKTPGTSYFLKIPKMNFLPALPANLLDAAPHRDGLDPDTFGYADGYVIAYDTASASYVAMDPNTMATVSSFYSHINPSDVQFGYPPGTGTFYMYDRKARVLSKYSKWW